MKDEKTQHTGKGHDVSGGEHDQKKSQQQDAADHGEHDTAMLEHHEEMKMSGEGKMKHDMSQGMTNAEHERMMRNEHQQMLWAHFVNVFLGVWLITSPFALGYRSTGLTWSDVASGAPVVVLQ